MDLIRFLEKINGTWFVQRTTYHMNSEKVITNKGYITIHPSKEGIKDKYILNELQKPIYHYKELAFNLITQILWSNSQKFLTKDHLSTVLIIPYQDNSNKFIRILNYSSILKCDYLSCKEKNYTEYFTLFIEDSNCTTCEKIWFPNNNLKLSVTSLFNDDKCISTSFGSEIRIAET
jgi:hypothetical protein|uniref:Chromophore lyase CpcS/CpeS n=1 Tax=Galdieria yellowstonensis TaxID=3028027 RepID=A0A9Y1I381_9RHOD|nr:phycobiliprotein lyase [Galdieria yellowstonensis]WDA99459.1 phycobiliprotein lyase [Galdieria yellowstonensis]